jgi:hypothetical protein
MAITRRWKLTCLITKLDHLYSSLLFFSLLQRSISIAGTLSTSSFYLNPLLNSRDNLYS